jgi:hypothetical protein
LKESLAELVVSVPTLRNEKNPTRALVIKKASEFVQASQRTTERLMEENSAYKEKVAQLQMYGFWAARLAVAWHGRLANAWG